MSKSDIQRELRYQSLIEILLPIFKSNAIDVTIMDTVISQIEQLYDKSLQEEVKKEIDQRLNEYFSGTK